MPEKCLVYNITMALYIYKNEKIRVQNYWKIIRRNKWVIYKIVCKSTWTKGY